MGTLRGKIMRKRKPMTAKIRFEVFKRDGFKCIYCGSSNELVVDHFVPFSKGGEDGMDNFVTACRLCNAGKRDSEAVSEPVPESNLVDVWIEEARRQGVGVNNWAKSVKGDYISGDLPTDVSLEANIDACFDFFEWGMFMPTAIFPWRENCELTDEEKHRINCVVSSGYRFPTVVLFGDPSKFCGFCTMDRYKGSPQGRFIHKEFGRILREVVLWGWYPDESLHEYYDVRFDFGDQVVWTNGKADRK